ncbi:MAG TPA: DUF2786 domain-containing protein [Pseudonocardia sp.]
MGADKLDTVRKLLAKADGAATPEEAQTYTEKAVAMMARHGIDEALLAASRGPGAAGRDEIGTSHIPMADPYSAGKARLLAWTASALRCRAVLHESGGGRVSVVTVLGFAADRARVELLYTSLLLQAGTQLVAMRPQGAGESVAAYRRSWLHGFAVRVHQRLQDAQAAALADTPSPASAAAEHGRSVALVLADRTDQVERAYAEAFPRLGRARRATLSGSGYAAGDQAGRRAELGASALRSRDRQVLGA